MSNSIHLLIIPSWYPLYPEDPNGSFFREQAIALKKYGIKVGVLFPENHSLKDIAYFFTGKKGMSISSDEGIITYRYCHTNIFPKLPSFNKARWVKFGHSLFKEYVKNHGMPDIIHAHSLLNAGILANELYSQFKIPFVVTEHSTAYARNLISKKTIDKLKPVITNASKCFAVSESFSSLLNITFSTNKWEYLPNIVNENFLQEKLLNTQNEKYTLINVCYLTPKKNINVLLHAFADATKHRPNLLLKIGGEGPEKKNLEILANQLCISDRVEFLGLLSRKEVLKSIKESDAFVLSSEFETFGVVLIEALALGKPIIATKCGGPESIITPEVGYLVNKNSIKALSSAIIALYDNKDKFKSAEIRSYCSVNFSESVITSTLIKTYKHTISQ